MQKLYYKMTLKQKQGLWGMLFALPWLVGFLLFFAGPMWSTVIYSFSEVTVGFDTIETQFIGFDNYIWAFTVDPMFNQFMITLAYPALVNVIIVVIFSLLAAILINGKYPGRSIVRTIFFIPIIMGANIAEATIVGGDAVTEATTIGGFGGLQTTFLIQILQETGVPGDLTVFVTQAVVQIFGVLAQSGVPILIFLAGLQSIPAHLYEVAKIEGSSNYETFWKVTLPMISPMIVLSMVFTIVDLFTRHSIIWPGLGDVTFLSRINTLGFLQGNYGLASSMVIVYILACLLIISLVTWIVSRKVFYYD